jgi:hypothetical protein
MAAYYHPYDSSGTESDESDDSEDRRLQDPRYAILRAAGPSLTTKEDKQKYMSGPSVGAPWDESTNIKSLEDHVYLDPPKSTKTSLVSIKSADRDRSVWPTPFRFQLKLPRTYKDVTKFQLVQMSFPNNANNVQASDLFTSSLVNILIAKGVPSTCLPVCVSVMNCTTASNTLGMIEQGRMNAVGAPLLTTVTAPSGSFTDPQLASELTLAANSTPPLNLITFSTFQDTFQNTGDVSVLFNEPGESYVSPLLSQRYGAHSKDIIMNTYYTQQHVDAAGTITDDVAYVAYYFPILKEAVGTGRWKPFFSTCGLADGEFTAAVLGPFQGFTSPLYSTLCHVNQAALDGYRPHLTFERRPINAYKWAYVAKEQRFVTLHDTLHASLVKDINKQYSTVFTQQMMERGLNGATFKTLKTNGAGCQAVWRHMERNLSSVLGSALFVSDLSYSGGGEYVVNAVNASMLNASTLNASTLNASTLAADSDITELFRYTSTFGRVFGCEGKTFTFRGLSDYHSTLSSYYQMAQSTAATVSTIHGRTMEDYHSYVATKYGGILPSTMLETRSYLAGQGVPVQFVTQNMFIPGMTPLGYTPLGSEVPVNTIVDPPVVSTVEDPTLIDLQSTTLPVQTLNDVGAYTVTSTITCENICCYVLQNMVNAWYSCVPVNTVINSLAYRTGTLNMKPGTFNIFSTVAQITSTTNMNLLMQINDEQGFNNMDVSMPEDYGRSNETSGQVKLIAGKILMGAIGDTGVSQTVIQNPTVFENTLGKLDRLDFKIYYDDDNMTPAWQYLPYFLNISEWNATFQIDEQIGFTNQHSGWGYRPSVPVPENPDSTPYLHFTHRDNPNNS